MINTDYDFITFGELNRTCQHPYATFNIWKDGKVIDIHYCLIGNHDD